MTLEWKSVVVVVWPFRFRANNKDKELKTHDLRPPSSVECLFLSFSDEKDGPSLQKHFHAVKLKVSANRDDRRNFFGRR